MKIAAVEVQFQPADVVALPRDPAPASPRKPFLPIALFCLLALLASALAEGRRWSAERKEARAAAQLGMSEKGKITLSPVSRSLIPMPPGVPSAHASALAPVAGDRMLAFWWAGSRESGPDVKIYASHSTGGRWGPARVVASRESLGAALGFGVRRVGNPVAWTGRDGTVHLYVVTTGMGGWAAARIVHLVSVDQGDSFKVKRLLPMSPLFNTSVLVRTTPVALADGGWWLPVYFEIGIKYPMLMSFDRDGDPRWLARIGNRTTTLQPTVLPVSATETHALMRDNSDERRVQHAVSRDGGQSWADMPALNLPNHSSSVAAWRLNKGGFVLLHNPGQGKNARNVLRLSSSTDGVTWHRLFDIANGTVEDEFSYPTLQQVGDELHISYTYRRQAIAHNVYRINYAEAPR